MAHIQRKNWQLSRREMLRGAGATLALPFLEAMRPLAAQEAAVSGPVRMACLFMPNGVRPDVWTPKGNGKNFELSPILSPLEALKEEILVISGVSNRPAHHGDGHYFKTAGWLTCSTIESTEGSDISSNGISIDQIAANAIGNQTKLPSMELGIEPIESGIDRNVNLTRLYGSHISWKKPDVPLPCEINPRSAFDRLFRDRRSVAGKSTVDPDKSVLDIVIEDAKSLKKQLGQEDTQKLDQYLESVREVERRIARENAKDGPQQKITPERLKQLEELKRRIYRVADRSRDNDLGAVARIDPTEHVRLMMDLMAIAFWTDSTRISTFMFGNAVSNKNFSFLDDVSGAHHSISHHKNNADQMDQYQRINTWHVEQYAYMLDRMKNMPEGDGNVLDNSMVLFGSGLRDGNAHNPKDIPLVLAGKARGQIETGRHLNTRGDGELAALYHGMLKRIGAPTRKVGDATREIRGL